LIAETKKSAQKAQLDALACPFHAHRAATRT